MGKTPFLRAGMAKQQNQNPSTSKNKYTSERVQTEGIAELGPGPKELGCDCVKTTLISKNVIRSINVYLWKQCA